MNERIKALALQAGAVNVWEWASDDVLDTKNMDAEKFAELIVNQCADIAQQHNKSPVAAPLAIGYVIREHFGVEE
jgi:hypothetical protein